MNRLSIQYEQDFNAWIQQHIELLKQGRTGEIDIIHLNNCWMKISIQLKKVQINSFMILVA